MPDILYSEQSINNILMLKGFVQSIPSIYEALGGARSQLLTAIKDHCRPERTNPTMELINEVINEDVTHQNTPLDLRNQRIYAVKVTY
jgi:DNA mismatch repair protein MSH4